MLRTLLKQVLGRRAESSREAVAGAGSAAHSAQALWDRAELARRGADDDAAEQLYQQALRSDPRHYESWMSLGTLCYRAGRLAAAHQHFRAALAVRPADAAALNELGLVEFAFGNVTDARSTFEELLDRHPQHADAWNNLGLGQAAQGDLAGGCRSFRRAIALRPDFFTAWANLGLACRDRNRPEEAHEAFQRACRLEDSPGYDSAAARIGLALALQDLGEMDAARRELLRAVEAEPQSAEALSALGALLLALGKPDDARPVLDDALRLAPAYPEAGLAMAHLLLARGRYEEGWDRYESRLSSRASPRRAYPVPHWDGAVPPKGRNVLVYGEQGLGEQIMFMSMLDDLLNDAASVTLHCEPRLKALFTRSFPHARVAGFDEAPGTAFDCCMAAGSLARFYRRTEDLFPRRKGYLVADPAKRVAWRDRLPQLGRGAKVGIAWRGGLASTGQVLRSLQPEALAPVVSARESTWVSLQHDARPDELARFGECVSLHHDAECLRDLDRTAALMDALDLVVAPCSTVIHLAGALGRPVWVLTPATPAWRYRLEGDAMPWYPSARLFRQSAPGDWAPVVETLCQALRRFAPGSDA